MFINNKYKKWYENIIKNARGREASSDTYYEKHHILPKSLGGNDYKENLVKLTAREHFLVHLLLTKFTTGIFRRNMCFALSSFHRSNKFQKRVFNSFQYSALRKISLETCLHMIKDRNFPKGKDHPMFGKTHSMVAKSKIRQSKFKNGWITPWGKFEYISDATTFAKNNNQVISVKDNDTLKKYCTTTNMIAISGKRSNKEWVGKTPFELGFGVETI
jgi:hypothetical protein